MGKLKAKDWRKTDKQRHPVDLAVLNAVQLADYQLKVRKQAARVLAINEEVEKHTLQHRWDVEDEFTDWLFGCFALVMHRKYGFGARRIAGLFDAMQEMRKELVDQGVDHERIWDMVRDEVHLDITTDGGGENDG